MRKYSVSYKSLTKRLRGAYGAYQKANKKDTSAKNITRFVKSHTIRIETFHDLIMEIAELSYKNPDVMLFYRGQNKNHKKVKYSTLYPTIYRSKNKKEIKCKFETLEKSTKKLLQELKTNEQSIDKDELKEIRRIKALQYSILQHYGVCETPLLDLTQSLKVACSFAILDNKNNTGYIYVLGLPYITGRISTDSEDYITNVRLLSIGCSAAKRPFFQEGYLVQTEFADGTDIEIGEMDFNRRLIAIYEFENDEKFWGNENPISSDELYPEKDMMEDICSKIKPDK